VPAATLSRKRPTNRLVITNPETGENVLDGVLKNKDEAKTNDDASKKEESKPAATPDAAVPPAGTAGAPATNEAEKMSVRNEFQSKIQELLAPKAKSSSNDDVTTSNDVTADKPIIHSDNSLSNSNSHHEDIASPAAAAAVAAAPAAVAPDQPETNEPAEVAAAPVVAAQPETPVKIGKAEVEGLEPVSPTPLPETPSAIAKKDVGASKPSDETKAASGAKKSAASKKAELNRKGAEKAMGNEMDVFTEVAKSEAVPEAEEAKPPQPPPASKPEVNHIEVVTKPAVPSDSLLSSSTSSLTSTEAVNNVDAAKENDTAATANHVKEEEEPVAPSSVEKEAEVVAAVVETNSSSSSEASTPTTNNVDDSAPVTENGTSNATTGSQIKLKYNYEEGQWSPCNREGKRQYGRDLLYELARDPKSLIKPKNLPHMDIIKDKAMITKVAPTAFKPQADFTPSFIKPLARGPGGGGGSLTKRPSREGGKRLMPGANPSGGPRVISIPERQPELRKAENAWKRGDQAPAGESAGPIDEVAKQTLAILNKLTPQKFDTLIKKFNMINIDTEAKLQKCIDLIFEKAVDEPGFSEEYAKMCKVLSEKQIVDEGAVVNFRKLLIGRCQVEFEKDYMEGLDKSKFKEELLKAETEEKKKEIQADFEDKERKARRRSAGNTRFIGELYKREMLTVRIMHECIRRLIQKKDEESLECLCRLVTTVGKHLEDATALVMKSKEQQQNAKLRDITHLDSYFNQMQVIIDQKQTTLRVRCLLMDVIDLRKSKWVPRRKVAGPKTIQEIHKDIEKEKEKQQLENFVYQGNSGSSRSLGGRDNFQNSGRSQDGRKRSQRDGPRGGAAIGDDGWSTKPSKYASEQRREFDPKMFRDNPFQTFKSTQDTIFKPQSFSGMWGKGSGTKAATNAPQPVMHNNRFDLLSGAGATDRSVSPMGGDRNRMASRSVGGERIRGGGGHADAGTRENALQAVRNFGRRSDAPNGPGSFSSAATSGAYAARQTAKVAVTEPTTEIGSPDREIAANQANVLKGDKFAGESNQERLETRLKSIIDEYIHQPSVEEVTANVKESCKIDNMAFCVQTLVEYVLEGKAGSREKLGYLLVLLVKERLLQRSQVVQGLGPVLESAIDLICDIPKLWEVLGELIAPLLESRLFSMKILPETASNIYEEDDGGKRIPCRETGQFVEGVLRLLCKKVDKIKVAEMWNEARLNWSKFLPNHMISDFVANHRLEYTQSSSSLSSPPDPSKMSKRDLKEALTKVMSNTASPDFFKQVFDFIDMYLKGGAPDNNFIRLVTSVVTRSCLQINNQDNQDPSQQNIQAKFLVKVFDERAKILKKIIDGQMNREKQALYAMQALMTELEYPSRMLQEIFEALSNNDLISNEAFEAWENCRDPAEQDGKGVAIKSTIQFFTMLKENEESGPDESGPDESGPDEQD